MTEIMERGVGVALWRQIAERLKADIAAGGFAPGDRLPTEHDLATRFGVNRHTLRRAMAVLAAEGVVRVHQGRGTFVEGGRIAYPIRRRTRFSEILSAQARAPAGRVTGHAADTADLRLAETLGLQPGAPLHRIETLSAADGVPVSVATHFVPALRFPRAVEVYAETGSFTRMLADHGVADYTRRSTRVTARPAEPDEAVRLAVAPGAALLVTESLDVDSDGRPVQLVVTRFAADRVELVVETE